MIDYKPEGAEQSTRPAGPHPSLLQRVGVWASVCWNYCETSLVTRISLPKPSWEFHANKAGCCSCCCAAQQLLAEGKSIPCVSFFALQGGTRGDAGFLLASCRTSGSEIPPRRAGMKLFRDVSCSHWALSRIQGWQKEKLSVEGIRGRVSVFWLNKS